MEEVINIVKQNRIYNPTEINLQMRAYEENGKKYITGYSAVFNQRSKQLYDSINGRKDNFTERILPGAFDRVMNDSNLNIILNYNHNREMMLGRYTRTNGEVKANSVEYSVDNYGLRYVTEVPNTTLGNDTYEMVKRGDLFEGSFSFGIQEGKDTKVYRDENNELMRDISNISGLYDSAICVDGAYAGTDVSVSSRELVDFVSQENKVEEQIIPEINVEEKEKRERKLRILKLK